MPRRIRAAVAEIGLLNALLYGLNRALVRAGGSVAIRRYLLVAQPITGEPRLGRRRNPMQIRRIHPGDAALALLPLGPGVLEHRFSQDSVCLGAFREGELRGCLWLCLGPYEEDEVRCRFIPTPPARTAWDFDVYVLPEYRSGLTFARLWDAANAYLHERGVRWSMSRISAFNPASLASHDRLGARPLASATFICLGRFQWMLAGIPPFVHLSWRQGRIPELRIAAPAESDGS